MPSFLGDLYSALRGQELYIINGLFGKRLASFSPVGRPPMHGMEAKAAGNGGQRLTSSSPRQCPARTPTECPARAQYICHLLIGRPSGRSSSSSSVGRPAVHDMDETVAGFP